MTDNVTLKAFLRKMVEATATEFPVWSMIATDALAALEAQEAKITQARARLYVKELWTDTFDALEDILSADAPTEPSPKASVSDTEDDSKLLSKFESSDPTEPAPVLERDPYEALVEGAANAALRHQPGTEGNGA